MARKTRAYALLSPSNVAPSSTNHARLSTIARLLRLASLGAPALGCASEDVAPIPALDGPAPTSPTCSGGSWTPLLGFRPARAWDYVALREGMERAQVGEPCATGDAACDAQVAMFEEPFPLAPAEILATHGAEVGRFADRDATRAFFGVIDSPDEALWLVYQRLSGVAVCPGSAVIFASAEGDGYRIETFSENCAYGPNDARVTVAVVTREGDVQAGTAGAMFPSCAVPGRRPPGLLHDAPYTAFELGALFAREAQAEAASIVAFALLARELELHAAPRRLRLGAERAMIDEVRHARMMARLARAHGHTVAPPEIERVSPRSLVQIALDNAVEGCVRELYCALRASYQARHAREPALCRVMTRIARDELRHASWSYALAHWIEPRLDARSRSLVERARREALANLHEDALIPARAAVQRHAGLPDADATRLLVSRLSHELSRLLA